jgi:hypothetical protein
MRLILLLLLAVCLTGCGLQYPYYCEDENAPICYLQRRPIFAPREKATSDPKPERRDGELPDDAPRSPSAPGAITHAAAGASAHASVRQPRARLREHIPLAMAVAARGQVATLLHVVQRIAKGFVCLERYADLFGAQPLGMLCQEGGDTPVYEPRRTADPIPGAGGL